MEDILASIKKVIAEEKVLRTSAIGEPVEDVVPFEEDQADDILELDEPITALAPAVDLGPPLLDDSIAGDTRRSFDELTSIAASVPAMAPVNPLEDVVREMLRPLLKQWVDEHLPQIVSEHVRAEISRITGRKV
ncbi:MAG: DUF2497 domain-containing protein [Sphingomicrobium sp.]